MVCITTKTLNKKKVRVVVLEGGKVRIVRIVDSPQKAMEMKRKLLKENKNFKFIFKFLEDER